MAILHRVACAVIFCNSDIIWEDNAEELNADILTNYKWKLDHGQWVCPSHGEERCCLQWNFITGCETHSPKHTEKLGIIGIFGEEII